uniref:Uncharacterized protein n=1 Tax=Anguilla anguilla TaxID=7936 RepID=A0A0E9WCI1_ANGAN
MALPLKDYKSQNPEVYGAGSRRGLTVHKTIIIKLKNVK